MNAADVRRWIAGFKAAAAADAALQRTRAARPPDPIRQSLSLINAAYRSGQAPLLGVARERQKQQLRDLWTRLAEDLGR